MVMIFVKYDLTATALIPKGGRSPSACCSGKRRPGATALHSYRLNLRIRTAAASRTAREIRIVLTGQRRGGDSLSGMRISVATGEVEPSARIGEIRMRIVWCPGGAGKAAWNVLLPQSWRSSFCSGSHVLTTLSFLLACSKSLVNFKRLAANSSAENFAEPGSGSRAACRASDASEVI